MISKQAFRARVCTIFCMREATYISDGFRMRAGPWALKTPSKPRLVFCYFSNYFEGRGAALGAMVPWCHSGAILIRLNLIVSMDSG